MTPTQASFTTPQHAIITAAPPSLGHDLFLRDASALPPQTTPWTAPTNCSATTRPVLCTPKGDRFEDCLEYDFADETSNTYLDDYCHPEGYRDIFFGGRSFSDDSTAAFPGTACPAGWSVPTDSSCKQNISRGSVYYSQAWCCPQGFDSCVFDKNTRNCFRTVATPTNVWTPLASRIATATSINFATASVNASPEKPLTIFHVVFPLAITSTTSSDGAGFTLMPTGSGSGSGSDAGQAGLSPAVIAGIVIGVIAGIALVAAVLIFLCVRRRRAREVRHSIVPHRTATSTPGLPENGSGGVAGVSYDPFTPGRTTPGLYGDPKMLTAVAATDPIVSRWHSPATVGAYAATARSTSPYDPGDLDSQGIEVVEQPGEAAPLAATRGVETAQAEGYYLSQKPGMPFGNVELAELESHPLDRIPVEMDSNPSVLSYEPTQITAAGLESARAASVSPLGNMGSAVSISRPPDEHSMRRL